MPDPWHLTRQAWKSGINGGIMVRSWRGGKVSMPQAIPFSRSLESGMIRIVLADPHLLLRQGLRELFATLDGVAVVADTGSGVEAWRLVQELEPDVIILEPALPELSGQELLARLGSHGLATRAIVLATHPDPALALEAETAGAVGYLAKEAGFDDLLDAVQAAVSGRRYLSPSLGAAVRALHAEGSTAHLSPREKQVLAKIAAGLTDKEIARTLAISPKTVVTHKTRLKGKLLATSKAELIRYAMKAGLAG